ncbi:MAG TPA: EF-hand domain-containing protein [Rhodanobacteraceae bacterium]|nr:EF-hand domain-containing protein [Rhodanobacteraceae bacterium]
MITTIRILALSSLLVSAACYAQVSPPEPSRATGTAGEGKAMTGDADWDALDSNKDGYLTKEELQGTPALVHNFAKIDTNGDGKVSMDEWKTYGHDKH